MTVGQAHGPGGAEPAPRSIGRPRRSMRPLGIAIVALLAIAVLGAGGFTVIQNLGSTASPRPSESLSAAASPSYPPTTGDPSVGPAGTRPVTTPRPTGTPGPTGQVAMPIVPVVGFWSTATDITMANLRSALQGQSSRYGKVSVPASDRDAIGRALGVAIAASVRSAEGPAINNAVKAGALELMRASDVRPSVRALSIDGKSLFGEARVKGTADWPLMVTVQAPLDQAWDQAKTWTLVAGGDMFLDRGVRRMIVEHGKDANYPFDGGTARVTGHHCCGLYVTTHPIPDVQLTGNTGALRDLTRSADLMIANLENPVPDNWVYHPHDYIFSGDPGLLSMFTDAGVDWVTLANNHIRDFGDAGVAGTRKNLAAAGLGFGGAGKDISEAGKISYLETNGTRIAIIACLAVGPGAWANASSAGGLPCKNAYVVPRIRQAKKNADVVIIFAHWGIEYNRTPLQSQRDLAKAWFGAGADLVLGAHTHVAGAIEEIDGHVVLYSMGNFIFDQNWWTITMESFLPEMTFAGNELVQMTLHPFVMADQAQPQLLDAATDDGRALLKTMRKVSTQLHW
jgi:poly-gamma-glutamate capsule biosynthesis protein CapA/YwtB (metallophosphatase superfamily)